MNQSIPFAIIHIPHVSTVIPEKYLSSFDQSKLLHETDVLTDWFMDELIGFHPGRIISPVSRLVCDMERFRNDGDEIMAERGMGAVYTRCSDGTPLKTVTAEEREDILTEYYDPHHKWLSHAAGMTLWQCRSCLIIDLHSFHPEPLPCDLDQTPGRPDFCIGTDPFHTPARLTEGLYDFLAGRGYSVKIDSPFSGTMVPLRYYRKEKGIHSIMIEVNRRLYLDAPSVKSKNFDRTGNLLNEAIALLEKLNINRY